MKLKIIFFLFFIGSLSKLNGAENTLTKKNLSIDDLKIFFDSTEYYSFPFVSRCDNKYAKTLQEKFINITESDDGTFLKSLARTTFRTIMAIRENEKAKRTPEEQNIKFTFAELVLQDVDSYSQYCDYLKSPEPTYPYLVTTDSPSKITSRKLYPDELEDISTKLNSNQKIEFRPRILFLSTHKQLEIFKMLYHESTTLKKILIKELKNSNPQIDILCNYLTGKITRADRCIMFLMNPTGELQREEDSSDSEEFLDASAHEDPPTAKETPAAPPPLPLSLEQTPEARPHLNILPEPSSHIGADHIEPVPTSLKFFNWIGNLGNITLLRQPTPISPNTTPKKERITLKDAPPWAIGGVGSATVCYLIYKNNNSNYSSSIGNSIGNYLRSSAHVINNFFSQWWHKFHFGNR